MSTVARVTNRWVL